MKVNIKGLVFTGFAAAILSANAFAAADDNIVTSKSYVDAQVATKQIKQETSVNKYQVSKEGTWVDANGAINVDTAYLKKTDNSETGATTIAIDTSLMTTTGVNNQGQVSLDTTSSKLVSEKAVAEAVNAVSSGAAGAYQPKNLAKMKVATVDSTGTTPQWTGMDAAVVEATNGYVDVALDSDSGAVALNIDANKITDSTDYSTTNNNALVSTSDNLITEGAVYAALNDADYVGNGQLTVSINGTQSGTFTANQSGTSDILFTGIEETGNKAAAIDSNNNTSTTAYASTKAVYDYVRSQTGGNVIPAMDSSICNDAHPCALVNESTGAHWRVMAISANQTNPAAGACGDAEGTGCNAGNNG